MTLLNYKKTHVEGQEDNSFSADDKRAILNRANKNVENKQKKNENRSIVLEQSVKLTSQSFSEVDLWR